MSEKNTLVNGMFVKEHTFESGTKVVNIGIKPEDFLKFMRANFVEDSKGGKWVNIKLIPNKNTTKYTHTPILNTYTPKAADKAIENLATEVIEEKQTVELPF
tara:strand:- start:3003 stop:3308 length:306 start_codon:yes stop_codon:yes gene_type:complete